MFTTATGHSMIPLLATGLLTAGLTACWGGDAKADGPENRPSQAAPLVGYERSGGLAGDCDRFQLAENGAMTVTGCEAGATCSAQATPAEVTGVRNALRAADFHRLPPESTSAVIADGYQYAVTYQGRTVRADSAAAPEKLRPVLVRLSELADRYGAAPGASTPPPRDRVPQRVPDRCVTSPGGPVVALPTGG